MRPELQQNLDSSRDRITQMLQKQSQPASFGQEIGDISQSLLSALSQKTGAAGYQQAYGQAQQQRQQQAQGQLQSQMNLHKMMQEEVAQGNEEAAAVDKAIKDITGNDINAYEKIAAEIHNSPEPANRRNATLLATRAATRMGYKPLGQTADELEIQFKKSQIAKNLQPDASGGGGATGVLINRYMQATGASFPQALHAVQSGMRQGLSLDEQGNIMPMQGFAGSREQIKAAEAKGTEIGKKQGELGTKAIAAPQVLDLIGQAKTLLPQASSGRVQAAKTGAMSFAGVSTPQSESDAQLDMIAAGLTLNVPRMEGPQSDRDTMLYRQAAGQVGNSAIPYKTRLAALSQLERLNKKYLNQNMGEAPVKSNDASSLSDGELLKQLTE